MPSHHNNPPRDRISEALRVSKDLTVLILNGHRLIEELLEDYVYHIFLNQRALDTTRLTFEQKLGLVLEHIDLPSWRDDDENDEDDNVDYRIAEEMLGNIKLLNKLRHVISQQILNCVQLGTLSRHAATHDLKNKVSQCLGLPPNTTDKELMKKTRGDILCLHAYLEGFMESTFEGGAN